MTQESCRVLVIDDNRDAADSAAMLLELWGHEARAVYSGEDALALVREFDPDVVLIDIGLPRRNGFDIGEDLKRRCPGVRLVALTGFTRADIVRRVREAPFDGHLTKPADPETLREAVATQCGSAAAR